MVSGSSFDKNIKKALDKECSSDPSDSVNTNTSSTGAHDRVNFNGDRLPPSEKIQLLFPKCKPRNEYQYQTSTTASKPVTSVSTNLISIASSPSPKAIQSFSTQANNSANSFNMNNSKLMKLQLSKSPDHKKQHSRHSQFFDQVRPPKTTNNSKIEKGDSYVETNPFRIDSNNQYFYTPNDSLFDKSSSAAAAAEDNSMMHHYHYPSLVHRGYQMTLDDRSYFFEPDEIEHNPYIDNMASSMHTIPSSMIKTSPPATPPALTTTPTGSSPIGSNRNIWDLSPIKSSTPTRNKISSPAAAPFSRSHKGSYKKLLSSPLPIEEDLETGHFYYNNKKTYYQAPQTDSDSTEPATVTDIHEVENLKSDSACIKPKIKHSESTDFIYAEVKKKEDRRIVKSKSGSGIMEYDGSPRRFGASSNDEIEGYSMSSNKIKVLPSKAQITNNSSPSPPRPGFPQRVVTSHHYTRVESPIEPFSFNDQQSIPMTTSQLIPTTFINNNSYETSHAKKQTIQEAHEDDVYKCKSLEGNSFLEEKQETQQCYDITSLDNANSFQVTSPTEEYIPTSTFDYLYEFSETRKVLEEFFKCPDSEQKELEKFSDFNESDDSLDIQYDYRGQIEKEMEKLYSQQIISSANQQERDIDDDNRDDKEDDAEEEAYLKAKQNRLSLNELEDKSKQAGCFVDSASKSSLGDENGETENDLDNLGNRRKRRMSKSLTNNNYFRTQSKNFNYSPDTTDYDSNYGDFDFENESPLRFVAPDYINTQTYNNSTAAHTTTLPSATVDLSGGPINNYARYCTSMPVLEDGLSSGHASDNENNNQVASSNDIISINKRKNYTSSISTIQKQYQDTVVQNQTASKVNNNFNNGVNNFKYVAKNNNDENDYRMRPAQSPPNGHPFYPMRHEKIDGINSTNAVANNKYFKNRELELESLCTMNTLQLTPPPPAPVPHRQSNEAKIISPVQQDTDIHSALKDIRTSLQKSKINNPDSSPCNVYNNCNNDYYDRVIGPEKVDSPTTSLSPVWIPRSRDTSGLSPIHSETGPLISKRSKDDDDEEEVDTDLETDRLLGHKMLNDGFYDEKSWTESKQLKPLLSTSKISPKINQHSSGSKLSSSSFMRHGLNVLLPPSSSSDCCINSPSMLTTPSNLHQTRSLKTSPSMNTNNSPNLLSNNIEVLPGRQSENVLPGKLDPSNDRKDEPLSHNLSETLDLCNLDEETADSPGGSSSDKSKKDEAIAEEKKKRNKNKEVLIEGVLFRARYLGSTQLVCEGQPTKSTRMMQAEEAVSRIKALAPDGENQPSTEVDLFISTEKIMVLNTDLKEIMMDHALRTISYIADIGDLVVLMARRRFVPQDVEANSDSGTGTGGSGNVSGGSGGPTPPTSGKINRTPKMICHVFESSDASYIASSIGTAFQVAYMEFLKANGIEDHSFMKEMDYQEVLNSQEIFGDELEIFAKKELQKEVVVPKAKGEILGVVIVESGWGSMLPTVVIANLASNGAAARCGQLNIGDQIIAINGLSLVGLPLSQCQTYIKNTKNQTVVKFTVVPCAPVVEVKIKRPNTKYQLGFSVQNGVICSLLRGGIAERGGVRVGHRIIEINNQSVVAVPHEKIVNLLATSVGEILMKTMPTSMFRLLTGQENPIYI